MQADSLPSEPPRKLKNTGVGNLSLLQGIFPTQESNRVLLHCRWILYQLSYQGSPKSLSRVRLFATPWTITHQAPLSRAFSRPEYWSGLPCPPPGDLPNPEIEPRRPISQADSLQFEPPGKPKDTGVGGLFLLQGIFLSQELNWGLLHCRQIL